MVSVFTKFFEPFSSGPSQGRRSSTFHPLLICGIPASVGPSKGLPTVPILFLVYYYYDHHGYYADYCCYIITIITILLLLLVVLLLLPLLLLLLLLPLLLFR